MSKNYAENIQQDIYTRKNQLYNAAIASVSTDISFPFNIHVRPIKYQAYYTGTTITGIHGTKKYQGDHTMDERLDTLYALGVSLYEAQEYLPAAICFKEAAELFHPAAQYQYAHCLEWGLGVEANADDALIWYERAAQLGYAQARCHLGDGIGDSKCF